MTNVKATTRVYNRAIDHLEKEELRREDGKYISRFYVGLKDSFEYLIKYFEGRVTYDAYHKIVELYIPEIKKVDPSIVELFMKNHIVAAKFNTPQYEERYGNEGYPRGFSHNVLQFMEFVGYSPKWKSEVSKDVLLGFVAKNK